MLDDAVVFCILQEVGQQENDHADDDGSCYTNGGDQNNAVTALFTSFTSGCGTIGGSAALGSGLRFAAGSLDVFLGIYPLGDIGNVTIAGLQILGQPAVAAGGSADPGLVKCILIDNRSLLSFSGKMPRQWT